MVLLPAPGTKPGGPPFALRKHSRNAKAMGSPDRALQTRQHGEVDGQGGSSLANRRVGVCKRWFE
jgi:hypothetical protein